MRSLSAQDTIRIWEVGLEQHPVDQALTMLSTACPEMSWDKLTKLSVGRRDAHLLSAREETFGPRLESTAECPACHEQIEFALNVSDIRVEQDSENQAFVKSLSKKESGVFYPSADEVQQMTHGKYELDFRLPNSLDLAAIAGCSDVAAARDLLVQRCVLQAREGEAAVKVEDLPEEAVAALAEQIGERDPQAEIQLNMDCPACGHRWQVTFDIVSFFWAEISAQAKRLLREVHTLAQAYGWRESDILSMSSTRRHYYLEMVT